MIESHDECGKVVHRPHSRYLSSVYKRTTLSHTPNALVVVHQSDPALIK